jgi:Tfp pilus assembly protein PilF
MKTIRTAHFFLILGLIFSAGCGGPVQPAGGAGKSANTSLDAAVMLLNQGKTMEAVGNLAEVIKADPNNAEAFRMMGDIFFSKNDIERAEAFYMRAVELDTPNGLVYDGLGQVYIKKNDAAGAVQFFLKAREKSPNLPDPYYHLGVLALASKETEAAINFFKQALSVDPAHPPTLAMVSQLEEAAKKVIASGAVPQ